jgi:hypothetical protein
MLCSMDIQPSTFVLKFFRTPAGELCCRATDTKTMESWTIARGSALWRLLGSTRTPAKSTTTTG